MIHILKSKASPKEISEMQAVLESYIKVVVDINRALLAGGGVMHADCEAKLLEAGSRQKDVWGADWHPKDKRVEFNSLINIRPRQNNRSMEIEDSTIKTQVEAIIRKLLEL